MMIENPYLREVAGVPYAFDDFWQRRALHPLDFKREVLASVEAMRRRDALVWQYAWAIPNDEAILTLRRLSPLVEIGAGTGYWAWLVQQIGGDVICYDKHSPDRTWTLVEKGDARRARLHPDRTLFLCWPPWSSDMASQALAAYRGRCVVYVGEWGGCTGDDAFHETLDHEWRKVRDVAIPCWNHIHDSLMIFRRKTRKERR